MTDEIEMLTSVATICAECNITGRTIFLDFIEKGMPVIQLKGKTFFGSKRKILEFLENHTVSESQRIYQEKQELILQETEIGKNN